MRCFLITNNIEETKELENCSFVKTVLMLFVVLAHSIIFWGGEWFTKDPAETSPFLYLIAQWINSFHIYSFALVSGYIFFHIKEEKNGYTSFKKFVVNKAKRLMVPYFFVAVVWAIPFQAFFFKYDLLTLIKNFIYPMNSNQLWFLWMLFDVFLLFWVLSRYFRNHTIISSFIVLLLYLIGVLMPSRIFGLFLIRTALCYVIFFWIGFKIRQYGFSIIKKVPISVWLVIDILLFVLVQCLREADGFLFKLMFYGFELLLHVVGSLMAFVVLQFVASKIEWKNSNFFMFLSKRTMTIYLFHQQIIWIMICFLNGHIHPFLNGIINFVISIVVSILISNILMKSKIFTFLLGEK